MKIELTHDLIAKKVFETVSAQDKARMHAQHILRVRYELYKTNKQLLLSADEVTLVQPYFSGLLLSEEEIEFWRRSRRAVVGALRWAYLRNFVNIALVIGLGIALFAMREHRRAERSANQNEELALSLVRLSADIRNMRTIEDLNRIQATINELRRTQLSDQHLAAWMRNTNVDSLLQTINAPVDNNEPFSAALQPFSLRGTVKGDEGKPLANAHIDLLGMHTHTDASGRFQIYLLTDPALLPPKFNLSVTHPRYATLYLPIVPSKGDFSPFPDSLMLELRRR